LAPVKFVFTGAKTKKQRALSSLSCPSRQLIYHKIKIDKSGKIEKIE
jgi:hypothetical protein